MKQLRRTIHPEIKVIDDAAGLVEYVASDETVDSYREIIRADGWRFNRFAKNAPFVDSHEYGCLDKLLGSVVDFKVAGGKLVETVKWAIDVPENQLAQLGWKMTQGGYLKAVSVGFFPIKTVGKYDGQQFVRELNRLGLDEKADVRAIYLEQEQIELSACIIGANPNALAKAYKAEVLTDADLELISTEATRREHAAAAPDPAHAAAAQERARTAFMLDLQARSARL